MKLKSEKLAKVEKNEEICGFAPFLMEYVEVMKSESQIFTRGKFTCFFIVVGRVHCGSA